MCEFKVFLEREKVFEEAVYVRTTEDGVVVGDILGEQRVFRDCYVYEVDVASEKLTLASKNPRMLGDTHSTVEKPMDILTRAASFHGHMGPFLIVGVRMGQLTLETLGVGSVQDQYGSLSAVVETGVKPPMSCIIDGIQWSTGCTLGKGKIRVEDLGRPIAIFNSGGHELRIQLRDQILRKIENSLGTHPFELNDLNQEVISLGREELFQVTQRTL